VCLGLESAHGLHLFSPDKLVQTGFNCGLETPACQTGSLSSAAMWTSGAQEGPRRCRQSRGKKRFADLRADAAEGSRGLQEGRYQVLAASATSER